MDFLQSLASDSGTADTLLMIGVGVATMLVLGVLYFATSDNQTRKTAMRRMNRVKSAGQRTAMRAEVVNIKRSSAFSANKTLDSMIKTLMPRPEQLRAKIAQAGLHVSLGGYLGINVGLVLVALVATLPFKFIPLAVGILFSLIFGICIPYFILSMLGANRRKKFVHNFPEAIDLMVRGVKSGLPITETIRVIGAEIPDPVGGEFRQIADAIYFGQKPDDALWECSKRLDIPEFNFFTVSLAIQAETGGNLAETLENLADVLRKRRAMKLKIKALSSEPKASAYIIGSLPFIMFGIIYMMSPDYITKLFYDQRGWMMLAGGLTSLFFGVVVMFRMVRFEI